MKRPLLRAALALVGLLVCACSGEDGLGGEPSSSQEKRFGLVFISYEHDWLDDRDDALLTTTAQFVRYSAMDRDQVSRLLALPLDPAADLPPLDQCRSYDLSVDLAADVAPEYEEAGHVELLEAGDLRIEANGMAVTLAPRHFPGLLPFISGVIYGEAQTTTVRQSSLVAASSKGGEAVGRFAVQLRSPPFPRLMRVGQQAPCRTLVLEPRADVPITWQMSTERGDSTTYLELRHSRGKRDMAIRCQLLDDGAFVLPRALLTEASGRASLEISRLSRSPFQAAGLDQAEVRVTVRDTATVIIP